MVGENRTEADRHREYREKEKQLKINLTTRVRELEEENKQLKSDKTDLQTQVSVLNEQNIRLTRATESNLITSQVVSEETQSTFEFELVFQDSPLKIDKETSTREENMDISKEYELLKKDNLLLRKDNILLREHNILLAQEVVNLKGDNEMMLRTLMTSPSTSEVENHEEEQVESNSIDESNGQPDSSGSGDPISRVQVESQVDPAKLLENFESLDAQGWNMRDRWDNDLVPVNSTATSDTVVNGTQILKATIPEDESSESQAMDQDYETSDEVEMSG